MLARRHRRIGKRGSLASAPIGVAAAIACAGVLAAPSHAEGFSMFGKGIEIRGLVYTQTGYVRREGTAAGKLEVKAGFLIGSVARCNINGKPTDVGEVYAWGRSFSQSFVCDPERIGTASEREDWGPRHIRYATNTSVTGNVVTLTSSWTLATTMSHDLMAGVPQSRSTRSTGKRMLRIRIEGHQCTVLAYSDQRDEIEEIQTGTGSPRHSRQTTSKSISNGPATTCTFID